MNRKLVALGCWVVMAVCGLQTVRGDALTDAMAAADKVMARDVVHARGDVDEVFDAADKLAAAGRLDDAAKYYLGGLRIYPGDFARHQDYADLLEKLQRHEDAVIQAKIVMNSAENSKLIWRASAIIGVKPEPIAPLAAIEKKGAVLVLMPAGQTDEWLLMQERRQLEKDLGITVLVRSIGFAMPPAGRDPRGTALADFRKSLEDFQKRSPKDYGRLFVKYRMMPGDISDDNKMLEMMARMAESSGGTEEATRARWLLEKGEMVKQWEATAFLDRIARSVRPFGRDNVRFMAITPLDIYTDDTNFLFGWRYGTNALVSYARFTAAWWDDVPKRARLLKRLHAQCLASAGHVFGLPRCDDPSCPRAYPHDLAEQDAKSETLCETCRKGFVKAFAQYPAN